MKSLQDYLEIYRGIARNLNLRGDSVEMIAQMLANATYISEVEHIAYSQEASLERATLMNSKIQHCMNEMYSVFRGSCPRVIIRFKSNSYFKWNVFDEIANSNTFNVYYLGYFDDQKNSFIYSPVTIPPTGEEIEYTIIGLISPKLYRAAWELTSKNQYYVNLLEPNLSNDIMVKVNGEYHDVTRIFADHIKDASIFDLTLPDFSLRLYAPDIFRKSMSEEITDTPVNTRIDAEVFKYTTLDSYNQSELKQLKIRGTKPSSIPVEWSNAHEYSSELAPGLIYIEEVPRDTLGTIHYKANRDRYMGSMLRSNSDIGTILEEMYPDKVRKSGTAFKFENLKTTKEITEKLEEKDYIYGIEGSDEVDPESTTINYSTDLVSYGDSADIAVCEEEYKLSDNCEYSKAIEFNTIGKFEDNKPVSGIIEFPITGSGTLKLVHKSSFTAGTPAVYEINPSCSVITLNDITGVEPQRLEVSITRRSAGQIEILRPTELSKYRLYLDVINSTARYDWGDHDFLTLYKEETSNGVTRRTSQVTDSLRLILKEGETVLDQETIYAVDQRTKQVNTDIQDVLVTTTTVKSTDSSGNVSSTTSETKSTGNKTSAENEPKGEILLDVSNDYIYLETTESGEMVTKLPLNISAFVYANGKLVTGTSTVTYSVEGDSGVTCNISTSGVLTISSIDKDIIDATIRVNAIYNGVSLNKIVMIQTSRSLDALKRRTLVISDDPTGRTCLREIEVSPEGGYIEIPYINDTENKKLYAWAKDVPGVRIYSLSWQQEITRYENVLSEGEEFSPALVVYYIPQIASSLLTDQEIEDYVSSKSAYYVTHDIRVKKGIQVNVLFNIKVELFQNQSIDDQVGLILENYSYKFGVDLENLMSEISSSISKITNIKCLKDLDITYTSEIGDPLEWSDFAGELDKTYFAIKYQISSTIAN